MVRKIIGGLGMCLLLSLPLLAHHPFSSDYDWKKPVTVTGKVTKMDWSNPHAHLYVDVTGADKKINHWEFEMGSTNALENSGWNKTTVKTGEMVTIDAWMSKHKNHMANMKSIKLPDGKELSAASSITEPETGK
jgi:hypothetical protein